MRVRRAGPALALAAGWWLAGCAQPIPRYQWTSDEAALRDLAQRAQAVRTIQATCTITMRDAEGRSVRLDGALVARHPHHLRVRAWKLHQPVFDLTARPDGVWVDAGRQHVADHPMLAAQIRSAWSLLAGDLFARELRIERSGSTITIHEIASRNAGTLTSCVVDRATLTPLEYQVRRGRDNQLLHAIVLEQHRLHDQIIWPRRISFRSSESGAMTIEIDEVEFNGEPSAAAFTPPTRAVRRP